MSTVKARMRRFAYTVATTVGLLLGQAERRAAPASRRRVSATHEEEWRLCLAQFSMIADRGRDLHSFRFLHDNYSVTRNDYQCLTALMEHAGVIVRRPRRRARWAGNWNRKKFQRCLKLDTIPLPYPEAKPPSSFFRREGNTVDAAHTIAQDYHAKR